MAACGTAKQGHDVAGAAVVEEGVPERAAAQPWTWLAPPVNEVAPLEQRLAGISTHLSLWPAAQGLARWLEPRQDALGLTSPGARILELGSGTGWLGRTLCANLPRASLMLTERGEAVDKLRSSCAPLLEGASQRLAIAELDWRDYERSGDEPERSLPFGGGFDVVLGSDLVWTRETADALPIVVSALLRRGGRDGGRAPPRVLVGHWRRAPRPVEWLLEACEREGVLATPLPVRPAPEVREEPLPEARLDAEAGVDAEIDWEALGSSLIFDEVAPEEELFLVFELTLAPCASTL